MWNIACMYDCFFSKWMSLLNRYLGGQAPSGALCQGLNSCHSCHYYTIGCGLKPNNWTPPLKFNTNTKKNMDLAKCIYYYIYICIHISLQSKKIMWWVKSSPMTSWIRLNSHGNPQGIIDFFPGQITVWPSDLIRGSFSSGPKNNDKGVKGPNKTHTVAE